MGAALASGRRRLARGSRPWLLIAGGVLVVAVATVAGSAGAAVSALAAELPYGGLVLEALALSTLLSIRRLVRAARLVDAALARQDLVGARALVAFHLVSRPTGTLAEPHVVSATVESVAENVGDSVVAPIGFYLAFGLAGAAAYRAVNTADAMLGYRTGVLEHFGKIAARLDDALNVIPARLAGLAIVAGAVIAGADGRGAWRVMRRDARKTASPNAGWPMAAMAGALGVTLEKRGAYRLGDGALPGPPAIARAIRVAVAAIAVAVGALTLARVAVASGA
jgi:adenosylcobinamide-phosphate synthase